jgi:type II secretory pathway pseudopilin PulG
MLAMTHFRRPDPRAAGGYTMVEIVVILAILTFISAILLSAFPSFNEGAALFRSQREVGVALRRAQNNALAVAKVEVTYADGTKAMLIPGQTGVNFNLANPSEYFMFADLNEDGAYTTAADAKIGGVLKLPRGLKFLQFKAGTNPNPVLNLSLPEVNVLFAPPEAKILFGFSDEFGNSGILDENLFGLLKIDIEAPNSKLTRNVTVRTTGQVSLE